MSICNDATSIFSFKLGINVQNVATFGPFWMHMNLHTCTYETISAGPPLYIFKYVHLSWYIYIYRHECWMKVEADWLLFFYYSPGQNMFYLVNFYFVLHLNLFESVKIEPVRLAPGRINIRASRTCNDTELKATDNRLWNRREINDFLLS